MRFLSESSSKARKKHLRLVYLQETATGTCGLGWIMGTNLKIVPVSYKKNTLVSTRKHTFYCTEAEDERKEGRKTVLLKQKKQRFKAWCDSRKMFVGGEKKFFFLAFDFCFVDTHCIGECTSNKPFTGKHY